MPTPVQPTSRYSPALAHKISQASLPTPPSRWRTYLPTYLPWRPASSQKDAVHNRLCGTEAVARLGQRLGELFLRVACWGLASKCRSMNDTGGASAEGSIGRSSDIWVSFGVTHSGLTVVCAGIHSSFCKVHGNGWKGLLEGVQSAGEARVDLVEAYTDCVHWLMKDHGVRRLRRRSSLTVGLPAAANVEPRTAPARLGSCLLSQPAKSWSLYSQCHVCDGYPPLVVATIAGFATMPLGRGGLSNRSPGRR